jgi:hypothetical protein
MIVHSFSLPFPVQLLSRLVGGLVDPIEIHEPTDIHAREVGDSHRGWLLLVPMNNTDEDVTITLRPNLAKLGFSSLANGKLRDVYRLFDGAWQGPPGWLPNVGDPESPYIPIKGQDVTFPMKNGVATVAVPKRNFRMLLLQPER